MHARTAPEEQEGILIRSARLYDVLLGWIVRRSDGPLLDLADLRAGDRVLDVGTGPGYLARAAARRVGDGGSTVGIDLSPEMIARARWSARGDRTPARFVEAGAESLPFGDASFEVVVSRFVVHHLPRDLKDRAMAEMARVLAPGGRLVVADMHDHSPMGAFHYLIGRRSEARRPSLDPLRELARHSGFEDVETGSIGLLGYVKARKPRR